MGAVPKLRHKSGWFQWNREFKRAFDHINPDYWLFVSGEKTEPSAPKYRSCDEDQVRQVLAQRFHIPKELVTRGQMDWYISETQSYNRQLKDEYDQVVQPRDSVREAYLQLLAGLGTNWENACLVYSEWINLRFSRGMEAESFVIKFRELQREVNMVLDDDDEVPVYIEFLTFMKAVCFHPNVEHFLESLPFDGYDSETMETIYSHFLHSAPY